MEGGVAGSMPLEGGPPPWTVKWQPLLGAPWLKAEGDSSGRPLDPRPLPALSGTHLPHCVQLHLHSYLRGRDDTEGTGFTEGRDLSFPLPGAPGSGPASVSWSSTCPSAAFHRGPWRPIPTWCQPLGWAPGAEEGGGGGRTEEGGEVSFMSAGRALTTHFQCHGGTCWRRGAQERVPCRMLLGVLGFQWGLARYAGRREPGSRGPVLQGVAPWVRGHL